ncbi:MAG: precorrin-6B methylase [Clostridia bacterium]|nr:precorrin-6B methylase [Clostridia bacterium]
MEQTVFDNKTILSWLSYFSRNVEINLAKLCILDITGKNKNLIPAIMSNRMVLVFTDAGHPDIFYDMWNAELGDCDIWYNEGSDPSGQIKHDKLQDMIDRGINASAAMLIINADAKSNYHIGMENSRFSCGSVHYVCREGRAVIMNKLDLGDRNNIYIISGESIAVEAAMIAAEGSVVAVEYDERDLTTMKENALKFGLNNVTIVKSLDDGALKELPAPDIGFIVLNENSGYEIEHLLKLNPKIRFVFYSLDYRLLAPLPEIFRKNALVCSDAIHMQVSRLNSKNMAEPFPAPWIISCSRDD